MKRVVITGGTGFVGANLAARLVAEGHEIYLFVRKGSRTWRIEHLLPNVRLITTNLLNREKLSSQFKHIRPDWIFHLATFGAYSWQDDLDTAIQTNFLGTVNLIEAARTVEFEAFIHAGSSSEYGVKDHAPREDDSLDPNSYYAVTKASSTLFCRYTAQRFKLPIFTLRLYSAYGPFEEPKRLIPTLIVQGLQGKLPPLVHPEIARDFIFIEDVNEAFQFLAGRSNLLPYGEVYNLGTGKQTSLREVVKVSQEIFHIQAEPAWGSMDNRSWDTDIWVADNQKLCQAGWEPVFSFREGFLKTVEWFKRNPALVEKNYR